MKNRFVWWLVSVLMVLSLVLASCGEAVEEEEEEAPPPMEEEEEVEEEEGPPPGANWWDKFGEPEYGGTIILRRDGLSSVTFDPNMPFSTGHSYHLESLFCPNWALDREVWPFKIGCVPDLSYYSGLLAESWELTDPLTFTVYLRQGVYWQDKPPVNGREFTSADVVYSFDRMLGTGNGFTKPNVFWGPSLSNIERVIATDKYTVEFKFNVAAAMSQYQAMSASVPSAYVIIAREWVEQGDMDNWENQVGTGAFILTDFVRGTSMTFTRNPNYYLNDERHPENQLPYIDTFKELCIPDESTTVAAMRTGKVDMFLEPYTKTWQQAKTLANTAPEIQQGWFFSTARSVDLRCDQEPCSDINVRKALQMAVDREAIAKGYYGGYVDGKPCGLASPALKGWVVPYDEWPHDLKAEYSYDPERAIELLTEAGYPNGFSIECVVSERSPTDLLEVIQAYFRDINVNIDIVVLQGATFSSFTTAGKHEMCFEQCGYPFGVDKVLGMRRTGETQTNRTYNNDPYYDSLEQQFNAAATLKEAQEIFREADYYATTQHWNVCICPTQIPIFWQPWIKGYSGEIVIGGSWYSCDPARWWVDQDLKQSMGH